MAARDRGIKQRRSLAENSSRTAGHPSESHAVDRGESNGVRGGTQMYEKIVKEHRKERAKIVLWRKPLSTLYYFARELVDELRKLLHSVLQHRIKVLLVFVVCVFMIASYCIEGPHQQVVLSVEKQLIWCGYWIGLGILSSVGLGTGLHTFLLYLGPHIASVTMAAWTCDSVDFPEPPYPQDIVCPSDAAPYQVTMWTIMSKVRLEAMMWGLGTAIGELPPYFMARAARRSGSEEEVEELEEVLHSEKKDPLTRAKKMVHVAVQRVGFFGILLCASIPNPLFDLAGITCGHFQIPFWTFFGATVIGKAIVKMHIQKLFVILAFSKVYVEWIVELIGAIPYVGPYIKVPFSDYLEKQKKNLHRKPGTDIILSDSSLLQWIFGQILLLMVVYFVISIINSMAQSFVKKRDEQTLKQLFPTTPPREQKQDL